MTHKILLCLLLSLATAVSNAQVINLDSNLVAYYPFTGTTNDYSPNTNDGINTGAQFTDDKDGNPNSALAFDGIDDHVMVNHSNELDFGLNSEFAISLWVKVPSNQLDLGINTNSLISKWFDGGTHYDKGYPYSIRVYNSNTTSDKGLIRGIRYDGNVSQCNILGFAKSTTAINDDKFHHIVFQKKGNMLEIYVDGSLEKSSVQSMVCSPNNSAPLQFGRRNDGAHSSYFKGVLDEIRFYSNRCLSQEEIGFLYEETTTSNDDIIKQEILTIELFPNPVDSELNIRFKGSQSPGGNIQIVSSEGSLLYNEPYNLVPGQLISLNVSHLPAGVYFLQYLSKSNSKSTKKFTIAH